jgi:hypothetical protein
MSNQLELPDARILADVRKANPLIEDQLYEEPIFAFVDSEKAVDATRFLIRNIDATEKELINLALEGHPDRNAAYRIRDSKKSHNEYRNKYIELSTKPDSEIQPLTMLQQTFNDLATFFGQLETRLTADKLTNTTNTFF